MLLTVQVLHDLVLFLTSAAQLYGKKTGHYDCTIHFSQRSSSSSSRLFKKKNIIQLLKLNF